MWSARVVLAALVVATVASVLPHRWTTREQGVTLEFAVWGMPFEDRLFADRYARDFEAMHEGVSVEYDRYDDLTDKYFTWHLAGEGADVMRVRITDYHALVEKGVLLPLDRFLDDPTVGLTDDERADFPPAIWSLLGVDGHRYALPSDNAQYGLYYNKAIFDEVGLAYPTAGWTWDDLRRAAERLSVRDDEGAWVRNGIDFDLWAWPFMALHAQAGGELWDDARTSTLVAAPAGREALQLIVDLLPHTASMRSVSRVGSASGPDKLFAGGQTAMLLDGSWRAPDLERVNPELEFAIAPLPRHRRAAVVSGSVLWGIGANCEHPELAWRMIRWMTSREQALRYWDTLRVAPPARISVIASEGFRETAGLVADGTVWVAPMPAERFDDRAAWLLHGVTPDPRTGVAPVFVPVAPYQKDLEEAIEAMLKRAVSPSRTETLDELLHRAAGHVHQIIDRDRQARGLPAVDRRGP